MAKYTVEEITKKEVWESLVLSMGPQTFLQSWNWGEVNRESGSKIFRLGFKKDGRLVGVALLIKEEAKRGPHFIIPGGPLINWKDGGLVTFFIKTIKSLGKKEGVWFVRVRPELPDNFGNQRLFRKLGFISAPMHLHAENTWVLDVSKSEDEIMSGMRKSTRYLVRKGEKEGLILEISKDVEYSKILYGLQKETTQRHKFVGFPEKLFKTEIKIFGEDDSCRVFVCKIGKKVLAAAIIIFYGETAYYHFSGSVSGFSKIPSSYFLQWKIIKETKKRGLKYYNFWGIAPNDNPRHRFAGVTLFKTGFGGRRVDWLHARDLELSPRYWLTYVFETARRAVRHL
jgi:lipid II:glycine glycyltransferase (peptidoglycan interpeptide bridge formation enzyme)